jgi:hypothetical protein
VQNPITAGMLEAHVNILGEDDDGTGAAGLGGQENGGDKVAGDSESDTASTRKTGCGHGDGGEQQQQQQPPPQQPLPPLLPPPLPPSLIHTEHQLYVCSGIAGKSTCLSDSDPVTIEHIGFRRPCFDILGKLDVAATDERVMTAAPRCYFSDLSVQQDTFRLVSYFTDVISRTI